MTDGQKMFLLAAQERNFSKAAEKAYVTPQCLSDHIKRLEIKYNVTLFQRRPYLSLTPEGQIMLQYLLRIQALEESMSNELADISEGVRGSLRFGLPATRGAILIPKAIPEYQSRFPHVDLQITLNDTHSLVNLLLDGKLDLFLGVDTAPHALLEKYPICSERLYLVVSRPLMEKTFKDQFHDVHQLFLQRGADIKRLQHIPFLLGHANSTTTIAITNYLIRHHIDLQVPLQISSYDLLVEMCASGNFATVCSQSHLRKLIQMEQQNGTCDSVCIYYFSEDQLELPIEIITSRESHILNYMNEFISLISDAVEDEHQEIQEWLHHYGF